MRLTKQQCVQKVHVKGKKVCLCRVIRPEQNGQGLIGDLVRGGVNFVKRYASTRNINKAGKSIMRIIRNKGGEWWKECKRSL